jgi:hypothetical protein
MEKAMDTNDITTRTLTTLRRDVADLRADVNAGFKRVDARMNSMDERFDLLGKRVADTEIRLSTEITAVAGTLQDVLAILRARDRRRLPDD